MIKLFKNIILGIVLAPLNAIMIVIALILMVVEVLLKRFKKVKNDLKSFIPITIHRFKMWRRYRKRK